MPLDAKAYYNQYWSARERPRAESRSRERAVVALELPALAGGEHGTLLDVGCGPGWALETFREAGYAATGIDVSSGAVDEAREKGLDARVVDVEQESIGRVLGKGAQGEGARFGAVVALEVLEHLSDPLGVLRSLLGLLEPEGRLVVSLPNEISLAVRLQVLAGRLPFGGHDDPHLRHFDRGHARRLFEAANCRVVREQTTSVLPPSAKGLRWFTRPLLALFPGAFALATLYLLEREGTGNA
jgi:SAM-dependent methyltransferase